ncbi:MAG: porin family protein [Chitinophagaceae bacterium]
MKKVLVFCAMTVICVSGFSQGFQLGVKAGVNISNYTGGNFEDISKKAYVGFHAGAFMAFLLGNHFAIQPEVLFSSQGAKFENAGDKENIKVSYINVPVMAKYRFTGGFYIEAGPQVGFKVDESTGNTSISTFAKDLDLSLAAGIGYHSPIGLGIGARYTAGLTKVGDFDASVIDPDFKNSVIQVSLFYTLFNNKK